MKTQMPQKRKLKGKNYDPPELCARRDQSSRPTHCLAHSGEDGTNKFMAISISYLLFVFFSTQGGVSTGNGRNMKHVITQIGLQGPLICSLRDR